MELLTLKEKCDNLSLYFSLFSVVLVLKQSYEGYGLSSKKAIAVESPGKGGLPLPLQVLELQECEATLPSRLLFFFAPRPHAT